MGGFIASSRSLQRNSHNFDAWHVHHSKNAQLMTRATSDNKFDNSNFQRNEERWPTVFNVQLGNRAFNFFFRVMSSIWGRFYQPGCSRRVCKSSYFTIIHSLINLCNQCLLRIAIAVPVDLQMVHHPSVHSQSSSQRSAAILGIYI